MTPDVNQAVISGRIDLVGEWNGITQTTVTLPNSDPFGAAQVVRVNSGNITLGRVGEMVEFKAQIKGMGLKRVNKETGEQYVQHVTTLEYVA